MPYDPIFNKLIGPLLNREGGYVNDPHDTGGETKYGIAARFNPGIDIKNLTLDKAKDIYYKKYWLASGADKIADPLARELHFDAAINQGVGAAKWFHTQSGGDPGKYLNLRKAAYQSSPSIPSWIRSTPQGWARYGEGWMNRLTGIMKDYNKNFPQGAHKPTGK